MGDYKITYCDDRSTGVEHEDIAMSETNLFRDVADERTRALDANTRPGAGIVTDSRRAAVADAGRELAQHAGGAWLLISGEFTSDDHVRGTEGTIKDMLDTVFDYPRPEGPDPGIDLNVLIDSPGGSLDSAYSAALYLCAYAQGYKVYVPRRAKSASTLLALGARQVHLSAFGELGPLDTQVRDPRNPVKKVSALDCYQSVDYVRDFGIRSTKEILDALIEHTRSRLNAGELLERSVVFALGAVTSMLQSISALDFGGWGRSLRIGERYAINLLEAGALTQNADHDRIRQIAGQLVFGYTHHLFPIDYHEAKRISLPVEKMDAQTYEKAIKVVEECQGKDVIGFLSEREASLVEKDAGWQRPSAGPSTLHQQGTEHPEAQAMRSESVDPATMHF
jgi:hypothetical protein